MPNTTPRAKTGIPGFDELIGGGFPRGKIILLSGTPGTCKTIFALQYLHNGATEFNEKGVYISFEEPADSLRNQAKQFGWDLATLEKNGDIKIISLPPTGIKESIAQDIVKLIEEGEYARVVVDSLSALAINTPATRTAVTNLTDIAIQRFMYQFVNELRANNRATTLVISQTLGKELSRDSVSEFVCDGVVHINYETIGGSYSRHLIVRKMRETKNNEDIHPLEINTAGLTVHSIA